MEERPKGFVSWLRAYGLLTYEIFAISVPSVFTLLLECLIPVFSIILIGHFGGKYLAAGSLANMIVNSSGYSITLGMANALDTLCSNAFGAKEYKLTGLHAQRGMVILTVTSLPIIAFWFCTEKILILGNVNPEIANLAQQWVYWQMISIIPKNLSNAFQKFLFAQSIVIPQICSVAFASGTYALAAYFLMYRTQLGYLGAAIAVPITETTLLIAMVAVYIVYYCYHKWMKKKNLAAIGDLQVSRGGSYYFDDESNNESLDTINSFSTGYLINAEATERMNQRNENESTATDQESKQAIAEDELLALDTWQSPFTWSIFKGWWEFFKLGLPAAVSLLIEWGSFEVNAFFISLSIKNSTTTNSSTPLAVHALLVNTAGMDSIEVRFVLSHSQGIWYMFAAALGIAATTMIGNALGAGDPKKAKRSALLVFFYGFIFSVGNGGLAILYREYWFQIWTHEEQVVSLGSSMMYVMWLFHVGDCLKTIGIAVARSCGKFTLTILVNAFCCVVIGYTVSYLLGIYWQFGIKGVWFGMACAWISCAIAYGIVFLQIDWHKEAEEAEERLRKGLSSME